MRYSIFIVAIGASIMVLSGCFVETLRIPVYEPSRLSDFADTKTENAPEIKFSEFDIGTNIASVCEGILFLDHFKRPAHVGKILVDVSGCNLVVCA